MNKPPEAGNAGESSERQKLKASLEFFLKEITQAFAGYDIPGREEQKNLESLFKGQLDILSC